MKMQKQILSLTLMAALVGGVQAADLVVVGNPVAAALSKEQVADIFLGKSVTMSPVDQVDSSPIRAEFYKKAIGRDLVQVKAVWARLVFSGKAQPPKELPDSGAVKKAIAADPKLVGYIEASAVDSSVKVLAKVE